MYKNAIGALRPKSTNPYHRRQFMKLGGMAVIGSGLMMACSTEDPASLYESENPTPEPERPTPESSPERDCGCAFDLGAGDAGLLNYLYALAQLGADYYTQAVNSGINLPGDAGFTIPFIYNHEVNQRELLKAAVLAEVGGKEELVLPQLQFEQYSISTLTSFLYYYADHFTTVAVAAYNGVCRYFSNPEYVLLASKIGSVHARHAASLQWYGYNGFFVGGPENVSNVTGLERAWDPSRVIEYHSMSFMNQFTSNYIP